MTVVTVDGVARASSTETKVVFGAQVVVIAGGVVGREDAFTRSGIAEIVGAEVIVITGQFETGAFTFCA